VPFRKIFVGEVDLEAGTIELLAPELLSLEPPEK
jgi:ribosomal 30S subunit maturation factor RimM